MSLNELDRGNHPSPLWREIGFKPLYLSLRDDAENIGVEMLSRKFMVKAVNDMVKQMRKIPDLKVEPVY
jgi:hypothetical protein